MSTADWVWSTSPECKSPFSVLLTQKLDSFRSERKVKQLLKLPPITLSSRKKDLFSLVPIFDLSRNLSANSADEGIGNLFSPPKFTQLNGTNWSVKGTFNQAFNSMVGNFSPAERSFLPFFAGPNLMPWINFNYLLFSGVSDSALGRLCLERVYWKTA